MNLNELSASDLMKTKVITVSESDSIAKAAKLMHDARVSSLVVERNGEADWWGIVTRKDIVEAFIEGGGDFDPQLVEDVMSKPALTVQPTLSVGHCLQIMKMVGIRRLPVVDGNRLVGVISNSDMFDKIAKHLNEE